MTTLSGGQWAALLAAGLGAGASIYNSNRQIDALNQASNISGDQNALARSLFMQTQPLRTGTMGTLMQVLQGGNPLNMRVFAPARETLEAQYGNARQNILNTIPMRGGQLNSSLRDLEISRASSLGDMEATLRQNAFNQALGTGFGAPPTALAGMGGAANNLANVGGTQAGIANSKNSSLGSMAGLAALGFMRNK